LRVKEALRFIIDSLVNLYNPGESESIAFILLEFVGFPRKKVLFSPDSEIESKQEDHIRSLVREIKTCKPVQYVTGETEFYGLRMKVDKNVLIPRQETEELVNLIVSENKGQKPYILDMGTGSGCIAVTLARFLPQSKVYATDISENAIKVAAENAHINNVNIEFITDNMLDSQLNSELMFDIIVSNPPYVTISEKAFMHANVIKFEPGLALFVADEDPLLFYRSIVDLANERLKDTGSLYVEINEKFGNEVAELFRLKGFSDVKVIPDIHEKSRIVSARKFHSDEDKK